MDIIKEPAEKAENTLRRHLIGGALCAFTSYTLVREARAAASVTDGRLSAKRWIDRQEEMARGLHTGTLTQAAWHDEVMRLDREVEVPDLMKEAARGRITQAGEPFMKDPVKRNIRFLDDSGEPRRLTYAAAIFSFEPESVITPHAHKHLATAHMVVDGRVRVRTFDRLADREGALLIRPTGDHVARVGEAAAMTTVKDNVHWFTPVGGRAVTFDVIISDLDPGQDSYLIQPLDPLGGERQADGSILAPLVSFAEGMKRYNARM